MASAGHGQGHQPPPSLPPTNPSLPTSRSSGPAYERPERARTSHACEPCRERKTKCDGDQPSCRRCAHTGTNCHYGYGKGWRKRKTVEDLNTTSRRLARYETLLNEIMPHVPPNVKQMIEDAREQDMAASTSGGSETTQTDDTTRMTGVERSRSDSTSKPGMAPPNPGLNPLSNPPPLGPATRRFESMSPTSVAHSLTRADSGQSPDDRLPSITAHGLLIEPSLRGDSGTGGVPMQTQSDTALYATDRSRADFSPARGGNSVQVSKQRSAPG